MAPAVPLIDVQDLQGAQLGTRGRTTPPSIPSSEGTKHYQAARTGEGDIAR